MSSTDNSTVHQLQAIISENKIESTENTQTKIFHHLTQLEINLQQKIPLNVFTIETVLSSLILKKQSDSSIIRNLIGRCYSLLVKSESFKVYEKLNNMIAVCSASVQNHTLIPAFQLQYFNNIFTTLFPCIYF